MNYPGGKGACYQKIINQMPPHRVYIEPFLGGGSVMRMKRPATLNIGIDRDLSVLRRTMASIASADGRVPNFFVCADALEFISTYPWQGDELVYLDPPYVKSSRRRPSDLYRFEMTDDDHARLLAIVCTLHCRIMISGYQSALYDGSLAGWRRLSFDAMTRGGSLATETLWMNFDEPVELHDYSFLGDNFRQREVIKRRKQRWIARLRRMDITERFAMLAALQELE
jgi:DNA adenine methylase